MVAPIVERSRKAGHDVRFAPGAPPAVPVRPTAIARLVTNLVDNAIAYGAPPVEVTWTDVRFPNRALISFRAPPSATTSLS